VVAGIAARDDGEVGQSRVIGDGNVLDVSIRF